MRRLEEHGIGRPSTWAAIIAVLQARGYAVLHERRLLPTERGGVLAAFLEHGFGRWMDYGLTAAMEDDLDRIAAGALARQGMLEGFWGPFEAALGEAGGLTRKTVRAAIEDRLDGYLFGPDGAEPGRRRCPACGGDRLELKLSRYGPFVGCADYPDCAYRRSLSAAAANEDGYAGPRNLGSDPGTGMDVSLRRGPTGWYVQRGERAGKEKPDRMSLPPSLEPDDLDLGLALRLLALPRRVGLHPETGAPILAGIGRYGPWVRHGETYAAIPDGEDVLGVGINRAVALIADAEIRRSRARGPNKVLRELGRHPGDGAPVRLKTGHYGPLCRPPAALRLAAEGPRPGGRDPGRRRGAAGTPVSSSAKDASSARCGDRKARSGAPAAAGRAGHGSMRVRAPARAVASSRGRARRRESAGDPVARSVSRCARWSAACNSKRSAGFPSGKARRSAIRTLRVSGSGSDGRIRCAHFSRRSSQVPEDAAHLPGVAVAGRGERHSVALPDKQLGSQKSLQLANMPADGAGRDPQLGRRVEEALMPARHFECLERVQRRERLIGHVFPRLARP